MKKYNEALERAKRFMDVRGVKPSENALVVAKELIGTVFPELRESEDERIRKELCEYFRQLQLMSDREFSPSLSIDDVLAYLEKQREYPTNEEMLRTLRVEYEKGVADTIAKYEQKEQKPAIYDDEKPLLSKFENLVYSCAWEKVTCAPEGETKEEYAKRWAKTLLVAVRDWADDYIDNTYALKLRRAFDKGFDKGKMEGEQKPAEWSEEQKVSLKAAENIL